jgi:hypothetical protein
MLAAKTFEVRDAMTFIPCVAVRCIGGEARDQWLLRRAGYGMGSALVLLTRLEGGAAEYDPHAWQNRTMAVAHSHIMKNWDDLASGSVLDVEFILGISTAPKTSEEGD